jgi:hypothetical protein
MNEDHYVATPHINYCTQQTEVADLTGLVTKICAQKSNNVQLTS